MLFGYDVIWQYVYDSEKRKDEIISYLNNARLFEITKINDSLIWGKVKDMPLEYKKYCSVKSNLAIHIATSSFNYDVTINVKDKMYRITLSNVVLSPTVSYGYGSPEPTSNTRVGLSALAYNYKKEEFKPNFLNNGAANVLNVTWYNTYLIKANDNFDTW